MKTSGLQGFPVDMLCSLTMTEPYCRVGITGVHRFGPFHGVGEGGTECAALSLGLGASFVLTTKIWCQDHKGRF